MQGIIMFSLVILSLLYQTALCYPTINTEDSKSPKFDPPINGKQTNEKKYFVGDGSDIIVCPVARGSRKPVVDLIFESNNTNILGISEITGFIEDFSTKASFKNLNIRKQDSDVTILCKAFYQRSDPETNKDSYSIILCFQENCDKDNEESTDVLLPLIMVAVGITLSLCIAKFLVVFQRNRELHTIDPLDEFKQSESIPQRQILLSDMKPCCSAEASST